MNDEHSCQGEHCSTPDEQVQWCHSYGKYLCSSCRYIRGEAELRTEPLPVPLPSWRAAHG